MHPCGSENAGVPICLSKPRLVAASTPFHNRTANSGKVWNNPEPNTTELQVLGLKKGGAETNNACLKKGVRYQ